MTVMSPKIKVGFYGVAKQVFPWDKLFDPMDYLKEFQRLYGSLETGSFKKYISILARDFEYPSIGRARNSSTEQYLYFFDSSEPSTPSDTALPKPNPLIAYDVLSSSGLEIFVSRVRSLIKSGQWYTPRGLRTKYHANNFSELGKKTFSMYMSLVYRKGVWEGLEREKRGARGSYMYRWSRPDLKDTRWESSEEDSVTVTPPPSGSSGRVLEYTCNLCMGVSPGGAKFCMHCAAPIQPAHIRTLVQEFVTHIPVAHNEVTPEEIPGHVRSWIVSRLRVSVEVGDFGEQIALVSLDNSK
jgi:hypothetical protein